MVTACYFANCLLSSALRKRSHIRNNGGLTPAELAASCGHSDCATYLQAAETRQSDAARGVYETSGVATPTAAAATFDVTLQKTIEKGVNGGHLPTAPPTAHCAMEESGANAAAETDGTTGGRKRARDCADSNECKRVRSTERLAKAAAEAAAGGTAAGGTVASATVTAQQEPSTDNGANAPPNEGASPTPLARRRSLAPYEAVLAISTDPMAPVALPPNIGTPHVHSPEKFCCPFV